MVAPAQGIACRPPVGRALSENFAVIAHRKHTVAVRNGVKFPHSTRFSGKEYHYSSKASRREDLQVEEPVSCRDCASFDFHPTLPGMLGATLIRDQVVQMGQPAQKRLLAPFGVMAAFHREQLPLDGVMGLMAFTVE